VNTATFCSPWSAQTTPILTLHQLSTINFFPIVILLQ